MSPAPRLLGRLPFAAPNVNRFDPWSLVSFGVICTRSFDKFSEGLWSFDASRSELGSPKNLLMFWLAAFFLRHVQDCDSRDSCVGWTPRMWRGIKNQSEFKAKEHHVQTAVASLDPLSYISIWSPFWLSLSIYEPMDSLQDGVWSPRVKIWDSFGPPKPIHLFLDVENLFEAASSVASFFRKQIAMYIKDDRQHLWWCFDLLPNESWICRGWGYLPAALQLAERSQPWRCNPGWWRLLQKAMPSEG